MPFQKVEAERLAQSVVRQIERLILQGILKPGERLPSERDLSEQLAVSRPSLREAVARLEETGLLTSRPGSGIYVAEVLGSAFSPALIRLLSSHDEAVQDYLDFRRDMEGLAADRAARLGSDSDLQVIGTVFARMEEASHRRDPSEEARLDAEFHMAIIEAGHNVVMLHMMRAMFDLLRSGVFYNRQTLFRHRRSRDGLLDQHRAIRDAILARDPAGARAAVETHLDHVRDTLADLARADRHENLARLRLQQEQTR